jgi:TonB family protein
MSILIYIIKTIVISGGLLSYYWFFLRNRSFHVFNRFFLLSIPLLGLLIPAFHFTPPGFWNPGSHDSPIRLLGVVRGSWEEAVTIYGSSKKSLTISWQSVAGIISISISISLFIRLVNSIRFLRKLRRQSPYMPLPGAMLYFVSEKGTPFSFFKSIFWGKEMDLNSSGSDQILRHELFHVQQQHSLDVLLLECCSIFMWFNPFLYIIRSEIKAIHEYAADAHAVADADGYAYAKLLLLHISGSSVSLVHPFFKNQIKRRITMLTKNKNKKTLLSRFLVLPVIAIFICLFSFKMQNSLSHFASPTIRVVIDPGHGGVFNGTTFNGIYEKNINLSIAKKIQALSKEYHVEVIMTREDDEDLAGNNLDASIDHRVSLASVKNADLFISIHMNATANQGPQNSRSGFEIYVPDQANKYHAGSVKLASSIADYIKPDYTIASELKEYAHKVRVLDQATVPAILIECGFIDNTSDLSWMQDPKNQEKIARDILEGIRKYSTQPVPLTTEVRQTEDTQHVIDTISINNINPSQIESMNVDRKNKLITLTFKNGKKSVIVITPEMIHTMDSAKQAGEVQQVKQDEQVSENQQAHAYDSSSPARKVEIEAEFPGGNSAWREYLMKKVVYPPAAVKKELQGEVLVEFVVSTSGTVSDVRATSGPQELRAEAVRAIKESGRWTPAIDQGRKVASYKTQPIDFKLQEK